METVGRGDTLYTLSNTPTYRLLTVVSVGKTDRHRNPSLYKTAGIWLFILLFWQDLVYSSSHLTVYTTIEGGNNERNC